MKWKPVFLLFGLIPLLFGCSKDNTALEFQGENGKWSAHYVVHLSDDYSTGKLTVNYKGELSELSAVQHVEYGYESSAGSTKMGFDGPPSSRVLVLTSGPSTGWVEQKEEVIKVTVAMDGKTEEILLHSSAYETFQQVMLGSLAATTQLHVGHRNPDGWEYTTKDQSQIELAIDYLTTITYKKMNTKEELKGAAGGAPDAYVLAFYQPDGTLQEVAVLNSGKRINLNGMAYAIIRSEKEVKIFFEQLKNMELASKGRLENKPCGTIES